jgi:hypothetical protein
MQIFSKYPMSNFNKESWEEVRGLSWVILDED